MSEAGQRWQQSFREAADSPFEGLSVPASEIAYRTLTYEVTGRIARITFNRPEHGNAITMDTPVELAHAVERADLDPGVHVMVVSGRGSGFCGGYDLSMFAEHGSDFEAADDRQGTMLDAVAQGRNHDPSRTWDPMLDYAMMSRANRGFASLLHATKPTVAKLHGYRLVRRPDRGGVGHEDRLPTDAGVGRASGRNVGTPPRRSAGQEIAVHR